MLLRLFVLIWMVFPLPAALIGMGLQRGRGALESSSRCYMMLGAAALITAVVWCAVLWLLAPSLVREMQWRTVLITASLVGAAAGTFILDLCNSASDTLPAQLVGVRLANFAGVHANFEVTTGPQAGLTLHCAKRHWYAAQAEHAPFLLRRGWLGLWWGEFPES
jgi:hypothetical protein